MATIQAIGIFLIFAACVVLMMTRKLPTILALRQPSKKDLQLSAFDRFPSLLPFVHRLQQCSIGANLL